MTYFVLSIIGLISAHRFISRLEKYFFIDRKKSLSIFAFLTVPIYFLVVIKEHLSLSIIYIGLILLSLIFFSLILEKKLKKVFLKTHLNVINGLLLQIKAGYSPQKAISEMFLQFMAHEKIIYEPLMGLLKPDFDIQTTQNHWMRFFFVELRTVLTSEAQVVQQLEMFKQGLKVKNKFILRTGQVTRQIKAQAGVAMAIYGLIFAISHLHLQLMDNILTVIVSVCLFSLGIFVIFKLGKRIRWTI